LTLGGGSVEILRDVLLCRDAEPQTLTACPKCGDESGHVRMALHTPQTLGRSGRHERPLEACREVRTE